MLAYCKSRYIHAMKVNYFMNRSAIDKGPDELNTQTKYQWTSMHFSFSEITIIARRKFYAAIESFRALLKEI